MTEYKIDVAAAENIAAWILFAERCNANIKETLGLLNAITEEKIKSDSLAAIAARNFSKIRNDVETERQQRNILQGEINILNKALEEAKKETIKERKKKNIAYISLVGITVTTLLITKN